MQPLDQQTILITGATDGLGRGLALDLAAGGATLLLHGRDDSRGRATLTAIRERTGSDRLHWYRADLAELGQVRALAAAVRGDHGRLDALVSNAGIGTTVPGGSARQESPDGVDDAVDRYALASPAALLPLGVPVLLVTGAQDDTVPVRQSVAFAAAAARAGDDVTLEIVPGEGHFGHLDPGSASWSLARARLDGIERTHRPDGVRQGLHRPAALEGCARELP